MLSIGPEALEGVLTWRSMPSLCGPVSNISETGENLSHQLTSPRAAFQFFRDLPFRTTQIMRRSASAAALSGRDYASSCILPHPDSLDVLPVSLAVGCVWLHEDKLQVGRPPSDPKARNAEQQQQPLDSLLFRLDAHNSQTPLTIDVSAIESHDDVPQSFLVTFDAQTPFPELYPDLVAQLDSLRQRGSLTHWEQGRIVQRPVTVVVTGEGISETDCSTSSYSDIFWIASPDELLDRRMSDVLSNVSPICLV